MTEENEWDISQDHNGFWRLQGVSNKGLIIVTAKPQGTKGTFRYWCDIRSDEGKRGGVEVRATQAVLFDIIDKILTKNGIRQSSQPVIQRKIHRGDLNAEWVDANDPVKNPEDILNGIQGYFLGKSLDVHREINKKIEELNADIAEEIEKKAAIPSNTVSRVLEWYKPAVTLVLGKLFR